MSGKKAGGTLKLQKNFFSFYKKQGKGAQFERGKRWNSRGC